MLYGPMKPVGLEYPDDYKGPRDGEFKTPYAVVQLRQDNAAASLYNIVGFKLTLKGRTKTGLPNDSRFWKSGVCEIRSHASQFLHGFSKSA